MSGPLPLPSVYGKKVPLQRNNFALTHDGVVRLLG